MFTTFYHGGFIQGFIHDNACSWQIGPYSGTTHSYRSAQLAITKHIRRMYLDWVNNFLTRDRFAEYYEMPLDNAQDLLAKGRALAKTTGRY